MYRDRGHQMETEEETQLLINKHATPNYVGDVSSVDRSNLSNINPEGGESGRMVVQNTEISHKLKIVHSIAIYYSTFAYGCGYTFLSPAILALTRQFDTDVSHISIVFTILTASYLTSALLCGFLYNILNRQLVMISVLIFMTLPLFIIPLTSSLPLFFFLSGILGAACGGYDVGQVAGIIDIWRGHAALFILIQHFMYSLGTILPPLIWGPFLPQKNPKISEVNSQDKPFQLYIPFFIAGSILTISVLIHIGLFFKLRSAQKMISKLSQNARNPNSEVGTSGGSENVSTVTLNSTNPLTVPEKGLTSSSLWKRIVDGFEFRSVLLTFLSCAIIGPYRGMELTTNQFLGPFSIFSPVHLSEYEGSRVLFAMNLAYAVGRGLGILVVLKCRPEWILVGNFTLLFVGNAILLGWGGTDVTFLWVGSITFGMGLSTVFPAYYSYIEKFYFVSHSVVSVITVSDGILASIYPLVVGGWVQNFPNVLTWVNFFSMTILFVSFGVTYWLTKIRKI